MANELVLQPELNEPYLLNEGKERQVKVCLSVMPSNEIRKQLAAANLKSQGADVCIVLDVSGSMREIVAGEVKSTGRTQVIDGKTYNIVEGGTSKLDAAVEAIRKLVPLLRDNDKLSFIAYEDAPHIIFNGYTGKDKDLIMSKLKDCYKFSGNTNISGALREARTILSASPKERPKKIIFLTDGQPVGDTEEDGIREGMMLAEYNISIDCLGFGTDFNYGFMEKVVAPSKGRTNIIKTPEEAEEIFTSLFKKSQDVVITNAKLKLTFSQQVRVTDHYRGTPENLYLGKVKLPSNDRTFTLNLSQIERDQRYDYYFLITVPGQKGYKGPFRIMKAELSYFIPALYGDEVSKTVKNIVLEFGDNPALVTKNGNVERGYNLAEIKRFEDEADEARKNNSPVDAIGKYEQIIERYETLQMPTQLKIYRDVLENYKTTGNVSLQAINEARRSSTQAAELGTLERDLEEENEFFVFGNKARGRR